MIKVSADVCEGIAGQIEVMPEVRANEIINQMITENPEFADGVANLFNIYIRSNVSKFGELPPDAVSALAANAILFSALSWKMVQSQHEANELNQE